MELGAITQLRSKLGSGKAVLSLLLLQVVFVVVAVFDIPVARQVFCFLYLTFIPGFIILNVLRLKLQRLETVVFSVGFSIVFLMFVGFLVNEFGIILGFPNPLSTFSLLAWINAAILVFSLLIYRSDQNLKQSAHAITETLKSVVKTPLALAFVSLPFFTVFASYWNNTQGSNVFLLVLIATVALLFVVAVASKKLMPSSLYPVVILSVAVSLLLHRSLVSSYVQSQASDIYNEMAVFGITQGNELWTSIIEPLSSSMLLSRYNDMLSITILPTVLSNLTNLDPQWVMKLLFPMFFSFVPLVLYCLWRKQFGVTVAFVAAFLFMAEQTFYMEMLGLARQMVGELFLGLLFLVLLSQEMGPSKKIICFGAFSIALITSHYALSMLFVFFAVSSLILAIRKRQWQLNAPRISWIFLFLVIMVAWYVFTAGAMTFESILSNTNQILSQAADFLNPAARGGTVLRGIGLEASPSIWNTISRLVAYAIQFLIGVGFLGLILHKVKVHVDFNRGYFRFLIPAMAFLAALIIVPGLAGTLNMTRFYHLLLFFLAPMAAIGAELVFKFLSKHKIRVGRVTEAKPAARFFSKRRIHVNLRRMIHVSAIVLVAVVLTVYFLFQTNFVFEVVKSDSWSLPLSGYRMSSLRLYASYSYIDGEALSGANWLKEKASSYNNTRIYCDAQVYGSAVIYSGLWEFDTVPLTNSVSFGSGGLVFLNSLNVNSGIVATEYYQMNTSQYGFQDNFALVYSNGACEIYSVP